MHIVTPPLPRHGWPMHCEFAAAVSPSIPQHFRYMACLARLTGAARRQAQTLRAEHRLAAKTKALIAFDRGIHGRR